MYMPFGTPYSIIRPALIAQGVRFHGKVPFAAQLATFDKGSSVARSGGLILKAIQFLTNGTGLRNFLLTLIVSQIRCPRCSVTK